MKRRINFLKVMRVFLALFVFVSITFLFVDFTGSSNELSKLAHLQLIPAILAGMGGIVIGLLLLTFIFGRIYCSVLCPFGILQDILDRISTIRMKKKKRKLRYSYSKAPNKLRYFLLGAVVVLFVAGTSLPLLFLDPYSNFGRIATNIFAPAYAVLNNLCESVLLKFNNYSLYHQAIYVVLPALLFSLAIFIVIGIAVYLKGRIFCNTLCPVGALLSLVSRYSLFRLSFDQEACNQCGLCEKGCKAECIDSKNKTVDSSRCVDCFNCISACHKGGMQYRFVSPFSKRGKVLRPAPEKGNSRRDFLATSATIAGTLPLLSVKGATGHEGNKRTDPILPPGAVSLAHFDRDCTACHLCVSKCPNHVIKPALFQFGAGFVLKPHIVYENGFCNYECTICSEVCPNHAIKPLSKEQKKLTQVGIAEFVKDLCIVYTEGTDCGACSEHCPTQAVHMVPYEGTLTIPALNKELCIGCGGCEYICPARPVRAIHVVGNAVQGVAKAPVVEEQKEIEVDDFGF